MLVHVKLGDDGWQRIRDPQPGSQQVPEDLYADYEETRHTLWDLHSAIVEFDLVDFKMCEQIDAAFEGTAPAP